ncbi:MAG: CrcB family protein [Phycisphaerae bacterium]|nr:CrcB family protein [Phycisphaerae bacterium]
MFQKLVWLGLAGAAGALSRYGLAGVAQRLGGGAFPVGTLVVNIAGCFLAGVFWTFAEDRVSVSGETRTIILVGFMGAFTTFSTYLLETSALMRDAEWAKALGNMALQNVVGLVALFVGLALGRWI